MAEAPNEIPEAEAPDGFRVEIHGEYGVPDGSIHLLEGDTELVMWDSAEWVEDPSLVFVIANAIARKGKPEARPHRHEGGELMAESPGARSTRMLVNAEANVPQSVLAECPHWDVRLATLTESTQDYAVDYDWQFDHEDREKLVLRRTVWTVAYRRTDRHIVWQGDVVSLRRSRIPAFVQDLTLEIIKYACDTDFGLTLRSYSGRGMSGKYCAAVDLDSTGDLVKLGAALAAACDAAGERYVDDGVDNLAYGASTFNANLKAEQAADERAAGKAKQA